MTSKIYRPGAGIMLMNNDGHIFVGQRLDNPSQAANAKGGIDEGETPKEAALRELLEEIGTNNAEIIAEHPEPLDYDLPEDIAKKLWNGKYAGQRQFWFLMRSFRADKDINLKLNILNWYPKWAAVETLPSLAVPFKRDNIKSQDHFCTSFAKEL